MADADGNWRTTSLYLLCQSHGDRCFARDSMAVKCITIRLDRIEPVDCAAVLAHLQIDGPSKAAYMRFMQSAAGCRKYLDVTKESSASMCIPLAESSAEYH